MYYCPPRWRPGNRCYGNGPVNYFRANLYSHNSYVLLAIVLRSSVMNVLLTASWQLLTIRSVACFNRPIFYNGFYDVYNYGCQPHTCNASSFD